MESGKREVEGVVNVKVKVKVNVKGSLAISVEELVGKPMMDG